MSITLIQLGKNLARNTVRMQKATGMTVQQQAEFVGISYSTMKRIKEAQQNRRSYNPHFKTVVKLAHAAGVSVDTYTKNLLQFQA